MVLHAEEFENEDDLTEDDLTEDPFAGIAIERED